MINFQQEAFTFTAKKFPNKTCLIDSEKKFTYSQMDKFSNKIANFLINKGIKPNDKVCIFIEKNFYLYASILGVLKAGACWVPLNKTFHNNRIDYLLEKIKPFFIICSESNLDILDKNKYDILQIDTESSQQNIYSKKNISSLNSKLNELKFNLTKEDLAYIIFTSGSTGKPKGVMVSHGNTAEFLNVIDYFFKPKKFLYFSHISEISFDPSIFDIFVCWKNSGILIPFNKKIYKINPTLFFKDNKKLDVLFTLPSLFDQINYNEIVSKIKRIKHLLFTGEPLLLKTVKKLFKINNNLKCYNVYGSTETAIISHFYQIGKKEKRKRIPVGKTLPNLRCKLIQNNLENDTGECYVSGPQISKGYFKDKISNEKYFKYFKNEENIRYYNIGDYLKYDKINDMYYYIGRKDDQVKINGIRLDIQELDSTILSYEGIIDSVSFSGKKYNLENTIHTFMQVSESFNLEKDQLIKRLKKELPYYMIPKNLTFTKSDFPRNANGKVIKEQLLKDLN